MLKPDAILQEDVRSVFLNKKKQPVIYGKQGEKVIKIADHGNVWIVKGESPRKFSVNIQSLKILNNVKEKKG